MFLFCTQIALHNSITSNGNKKGIEGKEEFEGRQNWRRNLEQNSCSINYLFGLTILRPGKRRKGNDVWIDNEFNVAYLFLHSPANYQHWDFDRDQKCVNTWQVEHTPSKTVVHFEMFENWFLSEFSSPD